MTTSSAIEVAVSAPDQDALAEASDAVVAALEAQPGLMQVESDLAASRPYLDIEVDRAKASKAGLTETAVAGIVAQRMQPSQVGQIVLDDTSIGIYLSQGRHPTTSRASSGSRSRPPTARSVFRRWRRSRSPTAR
ncbi:efflux RND transporter permease subunit [Leucobacter soli]|uniref:efflux RND transporter permease subunit n=1 Tax=Leucobacter soli TaxID=2812850 RepID=UPI0036181B6D